MTLKNLLKGHLKIQLSFIRVQINPIFHPRQSIFVNGVPEPMFYNNIV